MKRSRLPGLAAMVLWAAIGCTAGVSGSDNLGGMGAVPGTGGTTPLGCGNGLTKCGATCVNTASDATHCGGCNRSCAGGQVCDNGMCASTCSAGSMLCGASCAATNIDPVHCGNCTTVCRADQVCNAGNCACPAGQSLCSGTCAATCGTGGGSGTGGGPPPPSACPTVTPGRSPLRRLTTFEYNNTVRDLLTDNTNPGIDFPAEITVIGDYFGNNADQQTVQFDLATSYSTVAEGIANRATADAAAMGRLATCAGGTLAAANEESCARTIVTSLLPRAYRRTVTTAEIDEYITLYRTVRALSTTLTFKSGVAAMIEAILQSSQFLYRVELGVADATNPAVKKLTGRELATRLSYFFWQTMPDSTLDTVADGNMLSTPAQVLTQAMRMLDDSKARPMVTFFFDNILPLTNLTDLSRPLFPKFTATIGQAMRQETQRTLAFEIFENTTALPGSPYAPGSWPAILTAPYTFVNQTLFDFYGPTAFATGTPAVTGAALQKVNWNTNQRLGLLTQAGVMTGSTTSNETNPVLRGSFIMNRLLCRNIAFPTDPTIAELAMAPVAQYTGWTARERFGKHAMDSRCSPCHQFLDPVGLPLENYDAVGLWRTTEHHEINGEVRDTVIDPAGTVPGVGTWQTPIEMVRILAANESMNTCMASHWMQFAYGRVLDDKDACNRQVVNTAFKDAGYNIKKLLLALTQTDAFMYRSAQ